MNLQGEAGALSRRLCTSIFNLEGRKDFIELRKMNPKIHALLHFLSIYLKVIHLAHSPCIVLF